MATKEIVCPHCKKPLQTGNFLHDAKNNLLCNVCNGVVFAVTEDEDARLRKMFSVDSFSTSSTSYSWNNKKEALPIRVNQPVESV